MRLVYLLLGLAVVGCTYNYGGAYEEPQDGAHARLILYTPDTSNKYTDVAIAFIDKGYAGKIFENHPIVAKLAPGWHKVTIHRSSPLGAREELGKVELLAESNRIYYVRYTKTGDKTVKASGGSGQLILVEEPIGRQWQ